MNKDPKRSWCSKKLTKKKIILSLAFFTSRSLICRCSAAINKPSNGSFKEWLLTETWVRFPAETSGTSHLGRRWPWSSLFTVVTPTRSVLFDCEYMDLEVLMSWQLRCFADALQVLFDLNPSAVHVSSCMFMYVTHALGGAMLWAFFTCRALICRCSE